MDQVSESSAKDTHTPNTPELLSDEAAARAFPNRGRSRYAEVLVVLIQWEESELDAQSEVSALRSMFEICYGFTTDIWSIPTTNAHNKLMLKAVNFIEQYGTDDNLIIIYYGGHAIINSSRQTTWSCRQDISYASVRWSAIQSVFEESKSDVLFLLDCCSAPSPAPSGCPSVIETIAASGSKSWTPGPNRYSFTNALLHVLDEWVNRPSFSVAMLHSEVLSVLKHEKSGKTHWDEQQKTESKRMPIYSLTSEDPKSLSIEICRRTQPSNSWVGTLSSGMPDTIDSYSPENLHELTADGKLIVPHVLISIALEENQVMDVEAWHRWIRQFPALAQFALVEGVFASHATIILLSLPVLIWDMLPENLAVSFVAFVESRNLLSEIPLKVYPDTPKQKAKNPRGRPDSDTLQIPPPLPLIQQIEQALQKHKQQSLKEWEAHFKTEKLRLDTIVQQVRDEAQKKELEFLQERSAYREAMEKDMKELKKESRVIKEEAKRAWEELGRYEHEERDRTRMLRDGLPITIGGIQVIPMGETDDSILKEDRGRGEEVMAWVGSVKAGMQETPKPGEPRDGSRAPIPPEIVPQRQQSESAPVSLPHHPMKPTDIHPSAHHVEHQSPSQQSGKIAFDAPHNVPGFTKRKSNASHQRYRDEKSIASFKSMGSARPSPPRSVASEEREDSDQEEEYATGIEDTASTTRFGPGDRSEVDYVQEFLLAGDDEPWDLPRQTPVPREIGPLERSKSDGDKPTTGKIEALDPDQITLEPKRYKSESKPEPMKMKGQGHDSLLDWEKRGMQQKLGESALPRPVPERALEPTSTEPTKVKDVDPVTLQALENGHSHPDPKDRDPKDRTASGQVTPPPRKSSELASRTEIGPLTLQALQTYEKLQEELETHQATRRPERPAEHIPNRLSHITEREGDWEPRTPGKASIGGSPLQKRGEEKVRDKKALAAVEDAIKKLIIPEMEELKKESTHPRKNSDGSTVKVPWDSDEKSIKSGKSVVTRSDSIKHGKVKSSTKKAFEAVEDAIKKEAEALKRKEEEEEEMEALRKLRKEKKDRKRKDEDKDKDKDRGKRESDEKDTAKSAENAKSPLVSNDSEGKSSSTPKETVAEGKEVVSEKALAAVDETIKKLVRPEIEALKRSDSVKRDKGDKQKVSRAASQQSISKRDDSSASEKPERNHQAPEAVQKRTQSPAKSLRERPQKEVATESEKEGNPVSPLSKQKSERGLWWMERKAPTQSRESTSRLPSTSFIRQERGKVQRTASNPPPGAQVARQIFDPDLLPPTDPHHWDELGFRGRDVTPSMSSIPTAIPRSSINTSTLESNFSNPWFSRNEDCYSPPPIEPFSDRNTDSQSRPQSLDFPSTPNPYSQFAQSESTVRERERPLSTPTIPLSIDHSPRPRMAHAHTTNPNHPYSHFAQFEQSYSTPALQRVDTGSSSHSAAQSMHTTHTTQPPPPPQHQQPQPIHPTPHLGFPRHQHAPLSAVDQNPKHSFTFTSPHIAASASLSRSNSHSNSHTRRANSSSPPPPYAHLHNHNPHRHTESNLQYEHQYQDSDSGYEYEQNNQQYLRQPLPSPSPSETEDLLKNLILPELETLRKGEEERRAEEERSRREWEREFGIL
ncbi:tyrosine- phosphatase non-receptor type 6 protein [Rutstroemia sp. NJR-2017a BBW]|nr:tyrosine- phosphatase non-receptor type 6 protein [Rutstroemia sp. NJR-2017a BBW]